MQEKTIRGHFEMPIYYEDTDFSGYVYHSNYLRFMERAREQIIGQDNLVRLYNQGMHYVVAKAELTYKIPVQFADLIAVKTDGVASSSPVIHFQQNVHLLKAANPSEAISSDNKLCVQGKISIVLVGPKGKPIRHTPEILSIYNEKL